MYNEYRILNLYEIDIYFVGKFMFNFFAKIYLMLFTISSHIITQFMSTIPEALNIYTYTCVYQIWQKLE